ncbi:MAG: signal peptide peptidase SppA [Candidatus Woesearchaeota archaeon]|nr:signal peptide peptidase SppA [Candidatus Woesearchaeota archaeon]
MEKQSPKTPWLTIILVLVVLSIFSVIIAGGIGMFLGMGGSETPGTGNVAIIPIEGPIVTTPSTGLGQRESVSDDVIGLIEKAQKDVSIKAIVFSINSPGGSPVASDEIATAIRQTNANKTTVALIRDLGASGAFWIATATNHVVANPASFTGSIGVIGSYLEFGNFLDDHNVTYRRLTAGKYKDMGSPFKTMTAEEQQLFQQSLDELHTLFINAVAENRKLSPETVRTLATGQFYTGIQAKKYGLVDDLGGIQEVRAYLKQQLKTDVKFVSFKKPKGLFERLASSFSNLGFSVGQGIGASLKEEPNTKMMV